MLRRCFTAVAIAASAVSIALVAAPANAANGGSCTLTISSRVVVSTPEVYRQGFVTGACAVNNQDTLGLWASTRGQKPVDDFGDNINGIAVNVHSSRYADPIADVFIDATSVTWGRNTLQGIFAGYGCTDAGRCKVTYTQNAPTTDIRLATRSTIRGSRSHGVTRLVSTSRVYSPTADVFYARQFTGRFQSRRPGGEWHTIRNSTTTSAGYAGMTVRGASSRTQFRYVNNQAPHWWGSSSGVVSPRH